jgi:hypothetical protein
MDDFIALVAALIVGGVIGWTLREVIAIRKIHNLIHSSGDFSRNIIKIRIEHSKGIFYIYNMETNEFMAQGDTRIIVERNLRERFPDTLFAATNENLREVFTNDSL